MDRFMRRAVELAAENVREGGEPFGAVLVKDGEIVSEGVNELHMNYDVSGHAELVAIRKAQAELKTHDLTGFTMYASGEPCPMCLASMYFSGIDDAYFAASVEDANEAGLGKSKVLYEELKKPNEDRILAMKQMPLEQTEENPIQMWREQHDNG